MLQRALMLPLSVLAPLAFAQDLAGYSPTTDVTAQALIDVDVQELISLVSSSDDGWQAGLEFYNQSVLANLSRTEDGMAMRDETNANGDFFPFFTPFYEYFGSTYYAHDFITNGLAGSVTIGGYWGNVDFSQLTRTDVEARTALAETAPVALTLFMYVVRNLELAVTKCQACASGSTTLESSTTAATLEPDALDATCGLGPLDQAVAYYVGSLRARSDQLGLLGYTMADKLCATFATCSNETAMSHVNVMIGNELQTMQQNIQSSLCSEAAVNKDTIRAQLLVPLVQGVLQALYMFETDEPSTRNRWATRTTVLSAALLPLLFECSGNDATQVYKATKPGGTMDGDVVRYALQLHYTCLRITCDDVGGIWNATTERYIQGWESCNTVPTISPAPVEAIPTNPPLAMRPFPTASAVPVSAPPTVAPVEVVPSITEASLANGYWTLCWMTTLLVMPLLIGLI